MTARLEAGDNLILFPEGTSNDGNRVLPFKSAFFGIAEKPIRGRPLVVQSVSIAYTRLNGIPMGRPYRPFYAWYGDMELASHLWNVAGLGNATIAIQFHQPVTIEAFSSRKEMAEASQAAIADGVSRAISGQAHPADQEAVLGTAAGLKRTRGSAPSRSQRTRCQAQGSRSTERGSSGP